MAYSFPDKKRWVFTLEDITGPPPSPVQSSNIDKGETLMTLIGKPKWEDISCSLPINKKVGRLAFSYAMAF